ncbi:MAG: FAD-dependent monooxygenase, partial [Clostridia bacterium]|nr:FAD-dependent monooxygenase [Clostridia bacterium]
MYDIIIIGAGPTGATLARLLDKNLNIMIIDKRHLEDGSGVSREKCCGGLLAPAAQKALARQGLGVPSYIMESPQTFSVQSVDHDNGITKYYQRHYINIDRGKFDKWLVSLIPKNIEKNFGC